MLNRLREVTRSDLGWAGLIALLLALSPLTGGKRVLPSIGLGLVGAAVTVGWRLLRRPEVAPPPRAQVVAWPAPSVWCALAAVVVVFGPNLAWLYGEYTEPGRNQDMILHRLTQGAISVSPGRRLQGPKVAFLGSAAAGTLLQAGRVQDWMFGRPDGDSWSRERWIFVQLGRRWFWVRERASGDSPEQATRRFTAAAESFLSLEGSLLIR